MKITELLAGDVLAAPGGVFTVISPAVQNEHGNWVVEGLLFNDLGVEQAAEWVASAEDDFSIMS